MSFAEELAKLANLGILDHDGSLLGFRGNHIVNRQARGGGNSNCRWAGILIVADQTLPLCDGRARVRHPAIPEEMPDLGAFQAVDRVAESLADSLEVLGRKWGNCRLRRR